MNAIQTQTPRATPLSWLTPQQNALLVSALCIEQVTNITYPEGNAPTCSPHVLTDRVLEECSQTHTLLVAGPPYVTCFRSLTTLYVDSPLILSYVPSSLERETNGEILRTGNWIRFPQSYLQHNDCPSISHTTLLSAVEMVWAMFVLSSLGQLLRSNLKIQTVSRIGILDTPLFIMTDNSGIRVTITT